MAHLSPMPIFFHFMAMRLVVFHPSLAAVAVEEVLPL
jgi:hypothetical protein